MTSINDRLDNLMSTVSANHVETVQRLARLETELKGLPKRVGTLERRASWQSGIIATLSALLTGLAAYLKIWKP